MKMVVAAVINQAVRPVVPEAPMNDILSNIPRFAFFTGKGGVGKTTLACASALALAERGKKILLVSTDPASNLDEMLETTLSTVPRPVAGVARLFALNINPDEAARQYRERIVAPYRGVLPDAAIRSIEEQLSGACTTEIASFNEFALMIGSPDTIEGFDHVILDTAPTGHTLRLLSLPAAWNDFIAENQSGSSCLGPLSGLKDQKEIYSRAYTTLCDATLTEVVLVARADTPSLKEAARAGEELAKLGITRQRLMINAVFSPSGPADALAEAWGQRVKNALDSLPEHLSHIPVTKIPFRPTGSVGLDRLRALTSPVRESPEFSPTDSAETPETHPTLDEMIDRIAVSNKGVILAMGKGGVGKTTLAMKIAEGLVRRGHRVHLSTTDPADHITSSKTIDSPLLKVSAIDARAETLKYVAKVMETNGAKLDKEGRALLEEELRSPCIEEIAVFKAFARTVALGEESFVVLDTAPTGHTLLLLDTTEAYHREILRNSDTSSEEIVSLLPRLRDPEYTKVLIVTLPEATPVHEAAYLQNDLRRAGIEPYAWIVNQSFQLSSPSDPSLLIKKKEETPYLQEVKNNLSHSYAVIPWMA